LQESFVFNTVQQTLSSHVWLFVLCMIVCELISIQFVFALWLMSGQFLFVL